MKIITTYVAYDDKEFDTREACKSYECLAWQIIDKANDAYAFYDAHYDRIWPVYKTIEDWINWFDTVTDTCDYVRVRAIPSRELHKFIYRIIGDCLPEHKIGWFKYDYNTNEWVSAD